METAVIDQTLQDLELDFNRRRAALLAQRQQAAVVVAENSELDVARREREEREQAEAAALEQFRTVNVEKAREKLTKLMAECSALVERQDVVVDELIHAIPQERTRLYHEIASVLTSLREAKRRLPERVRRDADDGLWDGIECRVTTPHALSEYWRSKGYQITQIVFPS